MRTLLACLLVVSASGCPDVTATAPTPLGPTVEFDPANSIIPFPNNLAMCVTGTDAGFSPCTIGKVAIPPPACEGPAQQAIRTGVLNKLDGFGTFEAAMQVTFTVPVDPTSLDGHIVMYQRAHGAVMNDPVTAMAVPLKLIKSTTLRFTSGACTTPASVDAVTIVPLVPLEQKSTYTIAVLKGVKTMDGKDYDPSFTWALVRQKADPVTLDASGNILVNNTPLDPRGDANNNHIADTTEIKGLDGLWKAHAQGLAFLDATGHDRSTTLVAWEVTTQTTTDQLDPGVATSPAGQLGTTGLLGANSITCDIDRVGAGSCPNGIHRASAPYVLCTGTDPATAAGDTQCFLKIALGKASGDTTGTIYATGGALCQQIGCANIADILGAGLATTNYQTGLTNPLAGQPKIPGPWSDPIAPVGQGAAVLQVLVFIPTVAAGPSGTFETLVFGHGLTSSKSAAFVFAPQLASSPLHYATVAIDWVNHGSRAVQITADAALGCTGTPDPGDSPQCFAPIFTADLAQTRDNIRQSVLDVQRLVLALKACGATGCQSLNTASNLKVDTAHIVYTGQSLGGIFGTTALATAADLTSGVLDVPSVGLLDTLEHTETLGIRCQLVDALIDAGVLQGTKWNGSSTAPTGLCSDQAWQMQPGYQQFAAVARWVIDPSDGANYMPKLATKKFMIQEVTGVPGDTVVPNYATDIEGALAGLMPVAADGYFPTDTAASVAITGTNPTSSKWLRYPSLPASDATTGNFGNLYSHPSLLRPQATPTGLCIGDHTTVCSLANPWDATSADCAALGNFCIRPGSLGTARLQTDAITFISLNH